MDHFRVMVKRDKCSEQPILMSDRNVPDQFGCKGAILEDN